MCWLFVQPSDRARVEGETESVAWFGHMVKLECYDIDGVRPCLNCCCGNLSMEKIEVRDAVNLSCILMSTYDRFYWLLIVSRRLYWYNIIFSFNILKVFTWKSEEMVRLELFSFLLHWKFLHLKKKMFYIAFPIETLHSNLTKIFTHFLPLLFLSRSIYSLYLCFSFSLNFFLSLSRCASFENGVSTAAFTPKGCC